MTSSVQSSPVVTRGSFYSAAALAALLLIFAGFARTYYLRVLFETTGLPRLVHLHGAVMTVWFALLFTQARLIAHHRVALHRRLGVTAAAWAVVVLIVGLTTAVHAARRGFTAGPPPLVFLAVPLMDLVVFGSLTGVALANRRRPEVHRRLMLMGSVAILAPAVGRLPLDVIRQGGLPVIFGMVILAATGCVIYDTWRHRRLHPAFGWSLLVVVSSVPLRIWLAGTPAWLRFATWLVG